MVTTSSILAQVSRALLGVFSLYLLLVGAMALMQRRLIYLPERLDEAVALRKIAAQGLQAWPPGESYRAVVREGGVAPESYQGVALVFHGNATSAYHFDLLFTPLERLGWRVVVVEYPGYAGRVGVPTEHTIVADARETAMMAKQAFGGQVMLVGISIGCGVASALAADPTIDAAVVTLITPFDSLVKVAQAHYPWLPVRLFLSDKWDNLTALKEYGGKLNIISAGHDKVVPAAALEPLLQANPGAEHIVLPKATHNDWFWHLTDQHFERITARP